MHHFFLDLFLGLFNYFFDAAWMHAAVFEKHFHCYAGTLAAYRVKTELRMIIPGVSSTMISTPVARCKA